MLNYVADIFVNLDLSYSEFIFRFIVKIDMKDYVFNTIIINYFVVKSLHSSSALPRFSAMQLCVIYGFSAIMINRLSQGLV